MGQFEKTRGAVPKRHTEQEDRDMDRKEQEKIAREIVDGLKARGVSEVDCQAVLRTATKLVLGPICIGPSTFNIVDYGSPIGTAAK